MTLLFNFKTCLNAPQRVLKLGVNGTGKAVFNNTLLSNDAAFTMKSRDFLDSCCEPLTTVFSAL